MHIKWCYFHLVQSLWCLWILENNKISQKIYFVYLFFRVSGTNVLNIRSRDEYLVQIDVIDKDIDEFWDNRDTKVKDLEEAGFEVILEPRKITVDGNEYVEY